MATIKSYTDLEQSKKLAEILPLESADMEYLAIKENGKLVGCVPFVKDASEVEDSAYNQIYDRIACWSLSALMNIIEIEKVEICFNCNNNKYWVDVHFETLGSFCQDHELYDSRIDALIATIKKLKSRNLL